MQMTPRWRGRGKGFCDGLPEVVGAPGGPVGTATQPESNRVTSSSARMASSRIWEGHQTPANLNAR